MEYEDTRRIATPEGVELELALAGLGSRFSAGLIDFTIKALLVLAGVVAADLVGGDVAAVVVLAGALLFALVGYDILFEVRAGGRTPGGGAVGLHASAVRNLLRLVEGLPLSYVPAIVCILLTPNNQRLGDLAAGTVVARERSAVGVLDPAAASPLPERVADWDVSAVTAEELAAVRSFLGRRGDFERGARDALAKQLADRLRDRVGGVRGEPVPERFLEDLARVKASRRG